MTHQFQHGILKILNIWSSEWEEREVFEIEPNVYYFQDRLDWLIIGTNFIRTDCVGPHYHPELMDKIQILEIILGRGIMKYYRINERECVLEARK